MSKTIQEVAQKELWVLVSQIKEGTNNSDLERITPQVLSLIDNWASERFIWSGPFSDGSSGMAIFEATQDDATKFVQHYDSIVSEILAHHLYKWDVLWGSK